MAKRIITNEEKQRIASLLLLGMTQEGIANELGLCRETVNKLVNHDVVVKDALGKFRYHIINN